MSCHRVIHRSHGVSVSGHSNVSWRSNERYSTIKHTSKPTLTHLAELSANHNVTLQWIPSHCDLYGNEMADQRAKEGSKLPQEDNYISFNEAKT